MTPRELGNMPVFPGPVNYLNAGLSKRELFAAMAMQSLITAALIGHVRRLDGSPVNEASVAESAFAMADAMLAEATKDQP